jgi:hypothetical protein
MIMPLLSDPWPELATSYDYALAATLRYWVDIAGGGVYKPRLEPIVSERESCQQRESRAWASDRPGGLFVTKIY